MEWTKIKSKHFLYTDLSLSERGSLSTLLLLTAHLERIPSDIEIDRHIPRKTFASMVEKLSDPLAEVLEKVLEDVSRVHNRRSTSKKTSQKHRDRAKSDTSPISSRDTTEERREDKRREEKRNYAENVTMTEQEYNKLIKQHGAFYTEKAIYELDNYKGSNGKKYKSDYRAILTWVMEKTKKKYPISNGVAPDAMPVKKINREGIEKIKKLTDGLFKGTK